MEKLIVILLCLPIFCHGQTSDQTLQPHANGEDVVDAVIDKIRSKCILVDDKYLMRRIAAVETDFGQSSSSNTGGIWKVSSGILTSVKNNCQQRLRTVCNQIVQNFVFDASAATMKQLDVPLYSGLVMHAYISLLQDIGRTVPATKSDQANYWFTYIRPGGDKKKFIAKASTKISCSAVKMELVFAIDASGSVGSSNFAKTLTFLKSVVNGLQIAPDLTRVAVITYESRSRVSFSLNSYSNASDIINAISRIRYTGGGTGTAAAIDQARTSVFSNARKNVPKIFILISDGVSNSRTRTIAAATKLKGDTTTIFTIGIGNVNPYEMLAVASSPSCTHFFYLKSYGEIDAIIHEIQRESCIAPVTVNIKPNTTEGPQIKDNGIPSDNTTKTQNIDIKPEQLTSNNTNSTQKTINIKVDVVCGIVNIYAHDRQTPSPSIYVYKAIATDGKPGWIRALAGKQLYLSLLSQKRLDLAIQECTKPHYNISLNPPEKSVTVVCRENGKERPCTSDDIKISFGPLCGDDNVPNPCTKANILKNKLRFKHPKSPSKYIQCKVSGKMEIVKCPTGTLYDESQSVCDPQTIISPNSIPSTGVNPCTRQAMSNGQFYFANPLDNSTFIRCDEWGTALLVNCPNDTAWSQQAYTCVDHSGIVSPSINPCKSHQQNHSLYYENPGNRKSFIQCDLQGNAYTMPCPLGTVWAQSALTCIHDTIKLGLTLKHFTRYSSSPPPPPPTNSPSRVTTKAPTRCTFGEYLPHKDPHKYNVCQWNGSLAEMSCPGGLVWYQASKVCNWPSGSAAG